MVFPKYKYKNFLSINERDLPSTWAKMLSADYFFCTKKIRFIFWFKIYKFTGRLLHDYELPSWHPYWKFMIEVEKSTRLSTNHVFYKIQTKVRSLQMIIQHLFLKRKNRVLKFFTIVNTNDFRIRSSIVVFFIKCFLVVKYFLFKKF